MVLGYHIRRCAVGGLVFVMCLLACTVLASWHAII